MRCAIYTRKSTSEGLDQPFNSLDAQREACEAYIRSQVHEGWTLVPANYGDGGYTGGNTQRPGLQRLLADIDAGLVDVVVVYKIDRLTRSLSDFSRIAERLEKAGASFVAVTQSFNTRTSMGRLTLNVLLSFAQFEREIASERTSDKYAALRAKGMWTGGHVPFGYKVVDRRLVVVEREAEVIRHLFETLLKVGRLGLLTKHCEERGFCKRKRNFPGEKQPNLFTRSDLRNLLTQPIYIGKLRYRDKLFQGIHDPIVSEQLFRRANRLIEVRSQAIKQRPPRAEWLLEGVLYAPTGEPFELEKSRYPGVRSHKYRSPVDTSESGRLSGRSLDRTAVDILESSLQSDRQGRDLIRTLCGMSRDRAFLLMRGQRSYEGTRVFRQLVRRATLTSSLLQLELRNPDGAKGNVVWRALRLQRAPGYMVVAATKANAPDPSLVRYIDKAELWMDLVLSRKEPTFASLARRLGLSLSYVSSTTDLAFLAPDIKAAIRAGHQPPSLTFSLLQKSVPLPMCWNAQRKLLGMGRVELVAASAAF